MYSRWDRDNGNRKRLRKVDIFIKRFQTMLSKSVDTEKKKTFTRIM